MKKLIVAIIILLVVGCSSSSENRKGYEDIIVIDDNHTYLNGNNYFNAKNYSLKKIEDLSSDIVVVKALNHITEDNSINPNNTFSSKEEMISGYEHAGVLAYFMSKVEVISSSKGDLKKGDIIYVMYNVYVEDKTLHVTKVDYDIPLYENSVGVLFLKKNVNKDLKENYIHMSKDNNMEYVENDFYYTSDIGYSSISFNYEENLIKDSLVVEIIKKYNK